MNDLRDQIDDFPSCPEVHERPRSLAERVALLRELLIAAAPAPWRPCTCGKCERIWAGEQEHLIAADSRLIAEMRNALPELLSLFDAIALELRGWPPGSSRPPHPEQFAGFIRDMGERFYQACVGRSLALSALEQIAATPIDSADSRATKERTLRDMRDVAREALKLSVPIAQTESSAREDEGVSAERAHCRTCGGSGQLTAYLSGDSTVASRYVTTCARCNGTGRVVLCPQDRA